MKKKRSVVVCDQTGLTIEVQVWAEFTEQFECVATEHIVVAFKGVRVTNFNGVGLTMDQDATLEFNPKVPQAKALKEWFDAMPADEKAKLRPIASKEKND
jgi:replication factor A1